jgi:hypothetical protein
MSSRSRSSAFPVVHPHAAGLDIGSTFHVVTATARKLAVLFYSGLKSGSAFVEWGSQDYEAHYRNRVLLNLKKRAKRMGYELIAIADGQSLEVS